jgi:hypothetical protein
VLALAIGFVPAVAAAQSRSFEFKGIRATDTLEAHRAEFAKCDKYFLAQGCVPKDTAVGGVTMFDLEVLFADDGSGVSQIRSDFAARSYDTLVAAFTIKWGKPNASAVSSIQNGFGAKLDVPIANWKFNEGTMTLRGGDFQGYARMEFMSNAEKARIEALDKPKVDF